MEQGKVEAGGWTGQTGVCGSGVGQWERRNKPEEQSWGDFWRQSPLKQRKQEAGL